jgi:amphi-Trp domain-containing protein
MAKSGTRDVERACSARQFAAKLRRLADALEGGGRFTVQVAGARIRVPAAAVLSVEHEVSADGEELEFQLTWRR